MFVLFFLDVVVEDEKEEGREGLTGDLAQMIKMWRHLCRGRCHPRNLFT